MKTVFIFGAGASRQAGGPLMYDFLDRASSLYRKRGLNFGSTESFEDVFQAMSELSGIFSKAYLDLDNIEVLFGAIETAQLTGKFADRNEQDIKNLRNSIITLIYKTLESDIKFPLEGESSIRRVVAPQPYRKFLYMLKELREVQNQKDPHEVSFLTFNYDVCLDYALYNDPFGFDYHLKDSPTPTAGAPLLKLHGSINWGGCKECGTVYPIDFKDLKFESPFRTEPVTMELGSQLNNFLKPCCNKTISDSPVIVPPTWNKTDYHSTLSRVWKKASEELGTADNIFVIGYSLPETDSFFRYLYALGSESGTLLKTFCVVDPDETGEVKKRFESMLGRGISNRRIHFIDETFGGSIHSIKKLIQDVT